MGSQSNERLAISIAKQCVDVTNVNQMKLCKLPLEKSSNFSEASAIVKRYSYGKPYLVGYNMNKSILLIGATGTGKTTWINAMINYVLGVEWDDPFRFVLVDEEVRGASQAHSQTQGVTVYDIYYQDGFRVPFSLTIVDTPGFGDAGEIARDKEITSAVQNLFTDKYGILELDAVGFAVRYSDARLTHSQKYIFNSVLSIFGKDITKIMSFLVTFANGKRPLVLDAIKEAKLPCRLDSNGLPCHQKFNNGAIYANNQDEEDEMLPIIWKMSIKNFKLFFDELLAIPTISLSMTKECLENRKRLEMKLKWMQNDILDCLTHMEALRKRESLDEMHKMVVEANKNLEIKLKVAQNLKDPVHLTALNCNNCLRICQDDFDPNTTLHHSDAFCSEIKGMNAANPIFGLTMLAGQHLANKVTDPKCTNCGCVSAKHEQGKFRWICKGVDKTITTEEIRENYGKPKGKKMAVEELAKAMKEDVDILKNNIVKSIDEIKDLHNSLRRYSLHRDPLTTSEYIRMMIENEENKRQEGFAERIKSLEELLPLAKMTVLASPTTFCSIQSQVGF